MKPYGMDKSDQFNNPAIRKGYYGRYGKSRTHRLSYKDADAVMRKRERQRVNKIIQGELEIYW